MHTQLFRGIDGDAQTVIVENFIQTNASLDTADTDRFLAFSILQSEEIEPCFRCNALVEGFTGVIDLLLQQLAIRRQGGQPLPGALGHGIQVVQIVFLQRANYQHGVASVIPAD